MSDRDAFKDRERGLEEEYFLRKERELVEKMRRRVELEQQRGRIAAEIGVSNDEILQALQDLGYTPETVKLLHLMPLVQVAWASGRVETKERRLLLDLARASGIDEGSEADQKLAALLDSKPSDEVMEANLLAVNAVLQSVPEGERRQMQDDLIQYSIALASASRGLFGLEARISASEREVIERIVGEIAPENSETVRKLLAK